MITRADKEQEIQLIGEKFSKSTGAFIVDFKGMKVEHVTSLRKKLNAAESEMKVVRNTLAIRALKAYPSIESAFSKKLKGTSALVFSYKEVNATAKVLSDFAKDVEVLQIKTGMMDGQPLDDAKIVFLASLPGKDAMRAQLLRTFKEPSAAMARVLDAYVKKMQGDGGEAQQA